METACQQQYQQYRCKDPAREGRHGRIIYGNEECSDRTERSGGFRLEIVVKIKAFEEAFAHILGQVRFFDWGMHEIDGPPGGVQHNAAIITAGKMFFEFLAELGAKIAIDIGR